MTATLYIRRQWNDIFKILKERKYEPYIINPAEVIFKYKDCRQTPISKQELRKYCPQESFLSKLPKNEIEWKDIDIRPGGKH